MYDRSEILRLVCWHLERAPGLTRSELADLIGVDRHTLSSSLTGAGANLDDLRAQVRAAKLARIRSGDKLLSAKELAGVLGFSSARALKAWLTERRAGPADASQDE